jgi:rhodanese-related sulfurtransferase/glutaredoxin
MKFSLILVLVSGFSLMSCAQKKESVTVDAFEKLIKDPSVQLLDVRTMEEYNRGHIKNAMQANWNDSKEFANRVAHLNKEKTVYVYCQVGGRSTAASEWLQKQGFSKVIDLNGGLLAWQKAKKEVTGVSPIKEYSLEDFNKLIAEKDIIYLVDIGAAWCPPCVKMKPIIEAIEKEYAGKFKLINIDAGVHIELQKILKSEGLPTFIIYKNGAELSRINGVTTKENLAKAMFP